MTRFNWQAARYTRYKGKGARSWSDGLYAKREAYQPIIVVQGAGSPTNNTGRRIVHEFPTLSAARKAGFIWAV